MSSRSDGAVPVVLHLGFDRRLQESTNVDAYYVVSEALTNAAKYAQASEVNVSVDVEGANLRITIQDDGIGGADFAKGSDSSASATASRRSGARWRSRV